MVLEVLEVHCSRKAMAGRLCQVVTVQGVPTVEFACQLDSLLSRTLATFVCGCRWRLWAAEGEE